MTTFEQDAVALAWGAWVELGVSGWTRTHQDWAIDVEPLILLTAFLGDADGRLQDEATDWCIRSWRSVSKVRLKNVAKRSADGDPNRFGQFAATVSHHAGASWPAATEPRRFTATGRSSPPDLSRPSLAWLRLRAMFGTSARTEILRHFLSQSDRARSTASGLARATGYAKRNVAEESESLVRAGVLSGRQVRNLRLYALARRPQLTAFVGEIPPVRPDWLTITDLVMRLVAAERGVADAGARLGRVRARLALDGMTESLDRLDLELGPSAEQGDPSHVIRDLGRRTLGRWSVGGWDGPRFD